MPEKTTQKEHGKKTAPPSEKEVQPEVVIQIPLAELHPFPDHPFQVRDDDSMRETAESVKAYGVLVPAIVRPREEGGYEIIAGHRRKHACELAELAILTGCFIKHRTHLIAYWPTAEDAVPDIGFSLVSLRFSLQNALFSLKLGRT